MVHLTPTKVLLATTLQPVVAPLSGSLAHGGRLLDPSLHDEPTPQKMAAFERALHGLWREVGRRMLGGVIHRLEPGDPDAMPARLWWKGQA